MVIVFSEIERFGLCGDPLAGIVFETAAFLFFGDDTVFGTQHLLFVHQRTVGTVAAGAGDLFSEQHDIALSFVLGVLYMDLSGKSTPYLDFFQQ